MAIETVHSSYTKQYNPDGTLKSVAPYFNPKTQRWHDPLNKNRMMKTEVAKSMLGAKDPIPALQKGTGLDSTITKGGAPLSGFKIFRGVGGPFGAVLNMLWVMQGTLKTIARNTAPEDMTPGEQAALSTGGAETGGDDDKDKAKKPGWLASLKKGFGMLMPKGGFGDKLKILAFAGALWALTKWSDTIVPILADVIEFTKTKLLPRLKKVLEFIGVMDEEGNISWKALLGYSLAGWLALKLGPTLLSLAFKMPGGVRVLGLAAVGLWAMKSIFQIAGDWAAAKDWNAEMGATDNETLNKIAGGLAGDLEGGMNNALKNASKWAGIGAATGMVFGGPIGMLIGMFVGGAIGGILGWIGGGKIAQAMEWVVDGFNNMWKSVTTAISDIFYDREITTMVAGKEMKHTQRSGVGKLKDKMKGLEKIINDWMQGMWEKLTGWIPSVEDIKATGGDVLTWTKGIIDDIKLWFWDASKPQIIGIDLSQIAEALPSMEQIKNNVMAALPKWMRPKSQFEKIQEKGVEELKEKGFFNKDWAGKSEIDRSKIKEASNQQLQALLALEADDMHLADIDYIKGVLARRGGIFDPSAEFGSQGEFTWSAAQKAEMQMVQWQKAMAQASAINKGSVPIRTTPLVVKGGDTIGSWNQKQENYMSLDAAVENGDWVVQKSMKEILAAQGG